MQDSRKSPRGPFRLTRYFALTSLVAFVLVAASLYLLERQEAVFFSQVQREQASFFAGIQAEFGKQQEAQGRQDLLQVNEAGHVNLTRLFANVLWNDEFHPFADKASRVLARPCALPSDADEAADARRRACQSAAAAQVMALAEFRDIDARVSALMKGSTVFKIKVFDLQGMTVFSSEHGQIGENKADNLGWKTAVAGTPASELTHRDKFSAFEGVVENRDLISSYIPVRSAAGNVIGVFEIYSDVTPFLDNIRKAAVATAGRNAQNQRMVEQSAITNLKKVEESSSRLMLIVVAIMVAFYAVVLVLVRNAQRLIEKQAEAQERAIARESRWHTEKMTALATMSASIAHEIGNPLALISGNAGEIAHAQRAAGLPDAHARAILDEVGRIGSMTRRIADFAALRGESAEPVDVNHMVKAVCDFLGFDRRFRDKQIVFTPAPDLPLRTTVPDHLNEALMNLLEAWAEVDAELEEAPCRMMVSTLAKGEDVVISIACESLPQGGGMHRDVPIEDARFESAKRRVAGLGGSLISDAGAVEMHLPARMPAA